MGDCVFSVYYIYTIYISRPTYLGLFNISLSAQGIIVRISIIQNIRRQQYEISIIISDVKDTCYTTNVYVRLNYMYVQPRLRHVSLILMRGNQNRWREYIASFFSRDKILLHTVFNGASDTRCPTLVERFGSAPMIDQLEMS